MIRFFLSCCVCSFVLALAADASAQPPIPVPVPVPGQSGGNLARLPDDQIEGTIFEYKGTFKAGSTTPGEGEALEGKFRLEGSAIFDVGGVFRAPSQAEMEKIKQKIIAGKGGDIRLPGAPQQKRLGQYTKISGGRLRLDFDDKETMHGTMLINRKKGTDDVWIGTFAEREGTRITKTWQVIVRPIED
ncbi:MAG: hypothetical protein C0483_12160 [Pirellula sp.]|nr:hypothetical protein [Pirellula sp.]